MNFTTCGYLYGHLLKPMTANEYSLLALFEMTPDLVCIANREGYFKKINPAVSRTLHYTEEELMAVPIATFIHPDDRERTAGNRTSLLNNQPLLNFQNRYCTKEGETVWLEWTSLYIPDKEIVFAIAKVITPRKLQELELQQNFRTFKHLAAHFKNHNEKHRKHLAGELHEDLAQLAAAMKMKIEWVSNQELAGDKRVHQALEQSANAAQKLVDKLRHISYDLSPVNLSHIPLSTALQELCKEFYAASRIPCRYRGRFRDLGLGQEVKLDIYRICQEALQNVWQHADATEVNVSLNRCGTELHLCIADNGCGFDPSTALQSGLTSIHGRALSINGQLEIMSNKKGTTIRLLLPVKKSEKI